MVVQGSRQREGSSTSLRYWLGLDLGQSHDYSAACVMEGVDVPTGEYETVLERDVVPPYRLRLRRREVTERQLHITSLDRAPLRTSYTRIAEAAVKKLCQLAPRGEFGEQDHIGLCVDAGGVGRAVLDIITERLRAEPRAPRVHLWPTTATGGNRVTRQGGFIGVPKRDLVTAAVVALQDGRLKIGDVPNAGLLKAELTEYRMRMTAKGHDTYEGAGRNDDLVYATALAAWAWSYSTEREVA